MDFIVVLTTFAIISFLFYIYRSKKSGNSNLPGPKGYPVVGNTFDVDLEKVHLKLFEWTKTYGDIFQVKFFGQVFVVVSSSKVLRDLFSKEPNATLTSARPDTFFKKYMKSDDDVVFTSLDKEWIRRRKLMHTLLNVYGEGLQNLEVQVAKKLSEFRQELSGSEELEYNACDLVEDFVLSTIEILLVGRNGKPGGDFHKYIAELDDTGNAIVNVGMNALYTTFPFLRFLPLSTSKQCRKFNELRDGLIDFLENQSAESKRNVGIFPSMKELLQDGDNKRTWFREKVMESMLLDIVGAAFLTTRGMLLSLLRILMSLPDVQLKLQEELDRVVGSDRQPTLKDRYDMPYFEAVILETLRYISHLPTSLPHAVSDDFVYETYTIPKGANIIPNLWTMHHSEDEWTDPFTFKPERFLDEDGQIVPADHDIRKRFMGFGYGKRSCIGEVLAKSRIFLFLSTIMQVSTVMSPDEERTPMLQEKDMIPGSVMYPFPYKCKFVNRNVCN